MIKTICDYQAGNNIQINTVLILLQLSENIYLKLLFKLIMLNVNSISRQSIISIKKDLYHTYYTCNVNLLIAYTRTYLLVYTSILTFFF